MPETKIAQSFTVYLHVEILPHGDKMTEAGIRRMVQNRIKSAAAFDENNGITIRVTEAIEDTKKS